MAIKIVVVTPEATSIEKEADYVVVPLSDGEKGIDRGHSPMIGRLGYGELRLRSAQGVERYYVDGGFVQVENDVVSVMTSRIVAAADLDAKVAQEQLDEAGKKPAGTDELLEVRERTIAQARAQIRVANRA